MNVFEQAQQAYAPSHALLKSDRSTEAQLISQITSRLKSALAKEHPNIGPLAEALHQNRQLWTLLATDVADGDNSLPKELRAQIFYLAEFTFQHSSKVLAGDASADILIEINLAVLAGLTGQGAAA